jgi:hypothetical protein
LRVAEQRAKAALFVKRPSWIDGDGYKETKTGVLQNCSIAKAARRCPMLRAALANCLPRCKNGTVETLAELGELV